MAATGQALVVGGSSAIGAAVAAELAGLGHAVTLWGTDEERLRAAARHCSGQGDRVDVTDRAALTAAVDRLRGRGPLTAVVWAAGVFDWGSADTADPDRWEHLLDVGLTAAAVTTRLLLPALLDAAPSALVYVGSAASRQVFSGNAAYVASKHGLAGLAGAVFLDVRDRGVKVSLVSPALVAAGAGLQAPGAAERPDRLLQPEDVAAAVRFVVAFPARGCPTEVVLQPQSPP